MKAKINSIKPIKFISFLLIFMLIFIPVSGMLTSCKTNQGNNTNNTTGTAAGPTDVSGDINAATEIQDSLPANLDFNGATLNLFTRGDCYVDNTVPEFGVETENGDIINDAIYNRDKVVEDRLNIKLNVIVGSGWQNYANDMTKIRASIAAGDQSYDLIAGWSASIPTLSIDGILMNLSDLPYVDFTQPWWNQRIVNDLTIDNKLNFAVGDGNLSLLCNCVAMFVNNTVQQAYGLPNIYDTVFAGKWTIDAMDQLARSVSKDLNGDGKIDKSDQVGCVMDNYNPFDGFMQGSDIQMITK
ncbi:MAG: extracellular solute-binding protein, partial [Oscillospiraceae bacterium]|nr:extracellular solute-binding protein [Oscillospiraceae bacterium]